MASEPDKLSITSQKSSEKDQAQTEPLQSFLEVPGPRIRIKSVDCQESSDRDKSTKSKMPPRSRSTYQDNQKQRLSPSKYIDEDGTSQTDRITVKLVTQVAFQQMSPQRSSPRRRRLSRRGLSLIDDSSQFLQSIQFDQFERWLLLIGCSICNALVPCWMAADIQSQGITKSAWRTFILSLFLIPFVMNEQRNLFNPQDKFHRLLTFSNLKTIYTNSLYYSVWVAFGILAMRYTARSHTFCFLRLSFFFVTIYKLFTKSQCHDSQIGGLLLVSIGIIMMLWDSISLPVGEVPHVYYLSQKWWQRLLGDFLSILGCLVLLFLQKKQHVPTGPRFSVLLIYNLFVTVNLIGVGYFLGGAEFSRDPKIGILGLFTQQNFVGVFYVSIMLGINLLIANVLIDQIFSEVIRKIAGCFQIVITTSFYHLFEIQEMWGGLTGLALCFLVPGLMMIVGGQSSLQKLQMIINSQIYSSEKVVINDLNKLTQIVLRPVGAPSFSSRDIVTKSHHNLPTSNSKDSDDESEENSNSIDNSNINYNVKTKVI